MEVIKIGTAEIKLVKPENPRCVPMIDPKQPDNVASLCSRLNRRYPELPYTYHMRRDTANKLFYIEAKYKKL